MTRIITFYLLIYLLFFIFLTYRKRKPESKQERNNKIIALLRIQFTQMTATMFIFVESI